MPAVMSVQAITKAVFIVACMLIQQPTFCAAIHTSSSDGTITGHMRDLLLPSCGHTKNIVKNANARTVKTSQKLTVLIEILLCG